MSLGKKLFIGSSAAGACSADSVQPFGAESAYSSNVALYQLDGNANDTVGNHNSTASNVTYSTGKFGQCAVFNGSSQYITTGVDSSDISMTNTSFSCWVNFTAAPGGTIMDNGGATSTGRGLVLETGNGYIIWQQANGTSGQSTAITSASNSYNDGNWHHVVGTIDGNRVMKLYIDGNVESSTPTANSSATSPLYTLEIGRRAFYNSLYFNGSIDQVRIYDKALSSDEVGILYNETTSTASDTNVLGEVSGVALYSLDYDASDASGNYDGAPTDVTFGVDGQINYGAEFNGSSSRIQIASTATAPLNVSSGNFSISMWVNPSNLTNNNKLIYKFGTSASLRSWLATITTNGVLYVVEGTTAGDTLMLGTTTIPINSWTHIAITRAQGGNLVQYINGVATNTFSTQNRSLKTSTEPLYIGYQAGQSTNFTGSIDQVRMFQKALSDSEVSTLYGETACVYTPTTDTLNYQGTNLAYYKLDGNALDETSNNYDGGGINVTYEFGRYGNAAVFNGSNSYISLHSALANGLTTVANCISFWFYIDAEVTSSSTNNEIMTFAGSSSADGKIALGSTSGHITNETFSVTSSTSTGEYTYSRTNIPGGWNHAVVQWNSGDTKWDIFINGVQHTTYTNGTNVQRHWKLRFGKRSSFYFTGKLDQVRIFDSALDATAVENLYNEKQAYITKNASDPFGDNNEVAFYELENNANDSTGSYNGTWSGTPAYITGVFGQGADFNGTNRIDTGITSNYSSYTISVWAKKDAGGEKYIIQKGDYVSSSNNNFTLIGHNASGTLYVYNRLNGTTNQNVSGITLNTGEWFHLVVTKDSSNINTIYYNGVKQTTSSPAPANSSSNEWQIGGGDLGGFWDGGIDQVRIFDRALDGDEVFKLYAEVIN